MIKLIVMDVDGTMTDGGIYYDSHGNEMKKFNVKDGAGIVIAQNKGMECMILTGRTSECVLRRGKELGIIHIFQGIKSKAVFLEEYMKQHQLSKTEVSYIGDDINDYACMKLVGTVACPYDATKEIREISDYVCESKGGSGAVREFIEWLLEKEI